MTNATWKLVYSKPRAELKLAQRLRDRGIEVYCPVVSTFKQWSDRKKKVSEPLFKSYVFVKISDHEREILFATPGFVNFVYWLGKPVEVRDSVIEETRHFLSQVDHSSIQVHRLQPGREVEVKFGPLKGQKGIVQSLGNKKARLMIEAMGTFVEADISISELVG